MIDGLSIIIPTLNEEKYLPGLLQSIIKQQFQGKLEVIVVDAHSQDGTAKVAKSFRNEIHDLHIFQTKRGIAHQRNAGVKRAKYENLLFIDADIILQKNFLNILSKKVGNKKNFIYSFMLWPANFDIPDYLVLLPFYVFFVPIALKEKATPGGLMLTSKSLFYRINGFNENILLAEDLDFGRRAVTAGATYRFFLRLFGLHSTRRLRTMGRINFVLLYLKTYFYQKKYGLEALTKKVNYPFGHF